MISPTLLYRGTLGSSAATVATTSVNGQTTINSIVATNKTANARVFSITVGGVYFAYLMPIAAYQTITLDVRQVANPGTVIQAWADATTAVDLSISCALQTPSLYLGSGTGSPEGVLTANQGAEWVQTNDSQLTYLKWRKLTGSGNTGWYPDFEGRWKTWTTTWAASSGTPTLGNGTLSTLYSQRGKTIHWRLYLAWGSTTSADVAAMWTFTLPVTATAAQFPAAGTLLDTGTSHYVVSPRLLSTTGFEIVVNGNGNPVGTNVPFTWANGDNMLLNGQYEAA